MAELSSIIVLRIGYYLGVICLFVFTYIALHIWWVEKNKVDKAPKIPMSLCDKHGAYPQAATLKISVPAEGREDLEVEMCPVCWYERQREIEKLPFKDAKAG